MNNDNAKMKILITFQIFPLLATTTRIFSLLFCMLGFLPRGSNSLECYDCIHTKSRYPPGTPIDPKCIDPVKGGASKITCSSPDESCLTATGVGNVGIFGEMDIWLRRCVLPESKKKELDGCESLYGKLFWNRTFEVQRKLRNQQVAEPVLKEPPAGVLNMSQSAESTITSSSTDTAKQLGLDYVQVTGDYCICNTKDLCNTIMDANDPKGTINPPTTEDKGAVIEGASCAITLFSIVSQLLLHF